MNYLCPFRTQYGPSPPKCFVLDRSNGVFGGAGISPAFLVTTEWAKNVRRDAGATTPSSSSQATLSDGIFLEACGSVVVFLAEVSNEILAHHPAQRVFQFHRLDKEVVLGVQFRRAHGRLEIEAEPFLNAAHSGALGEIEE